MKQLLTKKELCEYLGISKETLRWILSNRRDFPGRVTKSHWSKKQIDRWLEKAGPYLSPEEEAKFILNKLDEIPLEITKDW